MKKYILFSFLFSMLFFSCHDLDMNPLSEGSSENWNKDETELTMSLRRLYATGFWTLDGDLFTDDWTNRTELNGITNATLNSLSGTAATLWANSYESIRIVNTLLKDLEKAKENGVREDILTRIEGELLFIRAVHYSKLVSKFGDVVYVTEPIPTISEAYKLGRTDKSIVMKGVYADFDRSAELLEKSYSGEIRATKGAAYAFKARAALYNEDFEIAADAALKCMDLGVYSLHPNFSELFLSRTKISNEFIFVRPRSIELNERFGTRAYIPRTVGGYGQYTPSWDLFCSFLCADGKAIDESDLYDPRNPFKNRDPRCIATIVEFESRHMNIEYNPHPDAKTVYNFTTNRDVANKDTRSVDQYASYNGLLWKKYVDDTWTQNSYQTDKNEIIMRYADVLLMYAEAKIELNEIDQSVLDAMNLVRARAYGVDSKQTGAYPAINTTDQAGLRKILRIERRMEFAFEGLRYMDIIRWRLAEKVLNTPVYGMLDPEDLKEKVVDQGLWFFPDIPDIDEDGVPDFSQLYNTGLIKMLAERKFDATRQYLWPLPADEVLINDNLKQNPNY